MTPHHPNHSVAILIMTYCDLENVVHIMKYDDKFGSDLLTGS